MLMYYCVDPAMVVVCTAEHPVGEVTCDTVKLPSRRGEGLKWLESYADIMALCSTASSPIVIGCRCSYCDLFFYCGVL